MSNMLKSVFPGKYIQGAKALNELPDLIRLLGSRCLILGSPFSIRHILPAYNLDQQIENLVIEPFRGECCEPELIRISEIVHNQGIDLLVGLGGGKTIDTAKIVADRAGIPVIIAPTIASTDAPCSGCAVIYSENGVFESVYYQKMNPQVVLVDMDILAKAPVRFLVSGMGDALATWFEARSCQTTQSPNECGGYATLSAVALARLCYDTLLTHGPQAKADNEHQRITPALNHIVEANTLLSGIGFESAGLAAAHSIHNGLTALPETHAYYHGEKVAFGVLTGLHLTQADPQEMETVYTFCRQIGLPTTLSAIGITNPNPSRLLEAAIRACAPAEGIHKEAVPVNPGTVVHAMIAADAMGQNYR